jgi:hypothetical protein
MPTLPTPPASLTPMQNSWREVLWIKASGAGTVTVTITESGS